MSLWEDFTDHDALALRMPDAEFARIIVAVIVGGGIAIVGGAANHILSERRWLAETRREETAYWRDYADKTFNMNMAMAELRTPIASSALPGELPQFLQLETLKRKALQENIDSLLGGTRRAPEPLTDHVRLFVDRMHRAVEAIPFDIELAKLAIVQFRHSLDEYVRRGRTRAVLLVDGESMDEYDRASRAARAARTGRL